MQSNAKKARLHLGANSLSPKGVYWIWYMIPALAFYIVFMAYPMLESLRLSFFTGNFGNRVFVGLQNFVKLFSDSDHSARFFNAFKNTAIFFAVHMLVQNVLGIVFAVLLTNTNMRGRKIYQTIIFVPTTFAVLVTGYLWKLLLSPVWSKPFLTGMGLGALAKPWLGMESTALLFVSLISCWQWIGIPTMMFVAALRNINEDIYEAAYIDGASGWQVFWGIKLPLLKPIIGMITILTFVNNFNAFDIVFAMENVNGAPGYSTDLIGTLFYRLGIAGQHPIGIPDPGMGAAVSTLIFIMLAIVSILILRRTETKG